MSDYTKSYNGAAKDAAFSTVLGAEFDTEFVAIATAIATKGNKVSSPTADNLVSMTASGDLANSGVSKSSPEFSDVALTEAADHTSTPAAGKSLIWARNDTPTVLMHTDDAGNDRVVAGVTWAGDTQLVVAASDESVTSSSTFQDDDELTVSLDASSTYQIEFCALFTSTSITPDFKVQWVEPDGTWSGVGLIGNSSVATATWGGDENGSSPTAGNISANGVSIFEGMIVAFTGGSGGTFKLQWAQSTSDPTATTRKAGSYLKVRKIA